MKTSDKKSRYKWRPFEEARQLARSLGLKSQADWNKWAKSNERPSDIPAGVMEYIKTVVT